MIEMRDTPAGTRFLDLLWAEAQRQQAAPRENKERDESPSRHAHSR